MGNPVVLAVTDYVPLSEQARYEALVDELHALFQEEEGFLSVDTVRYNRPHQIEYSVLSRWADEKAAQQWRKNKSVQEKLAQIEAITGGAADIVEASGIGLWFDHAEGAEPSLQPSLPPIWKRIALSVIGVYPMLILLLEVTAPIIGSLPQLLQVFIIVVVLSALLTWPIMPWLSRLLQPWLMAK